MKISQWARENFCSYRRKCFSVTYVLSFFLHRAVTKPLEIIKYRRFGSAENVCTTASSPGSSMYPACGVKRSLLLKNIFLRSSSYSRIIFITSSRGNRETKEGAVYIVCEIKNCVDTRDTVVRYITLQVSRIVLYRWRQQSPISCSIEHFHMTSRQPICGSKAMFVHQ